MAEALALEPAQRAAELRGLVADDVRAEVAVGPLARCARGRRRSGRSSTIATGSTWCSPASVDERLARLGLHVGRVDDGEPAAREPLAGDVVQHLEGVVGRGLVVLVVGDQAAAEVGREHLGRREVLAREGRLAGPGGADQDDEGELGRRDRVTSSCGARRHAASKTAICVGGPTSGSSGPIGQEAHA